MLIHIQRVFSLPYIVFPCEDYLLVDSFSTVSRIYVSESRLAGTGASFWIRQTQVAAFVILDLG